MEIPFHEDRAEVVKNEQPKGSDAQQVEIAAAFIETGGGHGRRPVCAKYRRSYGGQRLVGLCQCKCTGRAVSTSMALGAAAPPTTKCDGGAFKVVDRVSASIKNAADRMPFATTTA